MVVYRRTNTANGKVYVGKTTRTADERWTSLLQEVNRGASNAIHNAIRKHGAEAFTTDILYETEDYGLLSVAERFFILLHQSHRPENGYNLTLGGDGAAPGELNPMWGRTHTDEVKAKLRILRLGTKQSEDTKRKIGEASRGEKNGFYGKAHTEATRKKLSEKLSGENHPLFGKRRPAEFGRKVSRALTGITRSEETCRRISEAKRGVTVSPETRRKISDFFKKVPRTPEWRARIGAALKGKPKSVKHRLHLSESRKATVVDRECPVCGTFFAVPDKKHSKKCCSRKCSSELSRTTLKQRGTNSFYTSDEYRRKRSEIAKAMWAGRN